MGKKTDRTTRNSRYPIITVRDFNSPLSIINRTNTEKVSKAIEDLNKAVNQHDLIDVYRSPPPENSRKHSLFKCIHNIYQDTSYSGA